MQKITLCALLVCVLMPVNGAARTFGYQGTEANKGTEVADSIQFLKQFHLGMTYDEVQHALPKSLQQDGLAYSTRDNVFLLGVGKSTDDAWSAYLMFDTSDLEIKKPEHLVEIDCSSTIPVTNETFESVVRRVSISFGPPIKLDSSERTSRAGWQTVGGSLLTVEYTPMTGAAPRTQCVVDFIVKSPTRKQSKETIA